MLQALKMPSAATMTRARYKLDALLMLSRQYDWASSGYDRSWITLCEFLSDHALQFGDGSDGSSSYLFLRVRL